ncbi:MAG: hypothetical protein V4819_19285 [Verrucomicrobiota bacterium]
MQKTDIESLAGRLYDTYCAAVGGVAFNGDPLPKWDAFRADTTKQKQSDAWIASAGEGMRISHAENCVPGYWMCRTCNFRLQKRIIGTQAVGDDTRVHTEPCPNDGDVMFPVTWEEYSQGLELLNDQKRAELRELRESRVKPRIDREFHEFLKDYFAGYEMRGDNLGEDYTPNPQELAIAEDALTGLLDDDEFLSFVIQFRTGSMNEGIAAIAGERLRQILDEKFSAENDDKQTQGGLAQAASCYASTAAMQLEKEIKTLPPCFIHKNWPWAREWWKPSNDPIRNLEKAGALIAAEIDRLKRIAP